MSTDATLFPLPVSPSPRLKWLSDKNVVTTHCLDCTADYRWSASIGSFEDFVEEWQLCEDGKLAYGTSEQEAIEKLAVAQGWPLWNQI